MHETPSVRRMREIRTSGGMREEDHKSSSTRPVNFFGRSEDGGEVGKFDFAVMQAGLETLPKVTDAVFCLRVSQSTFGQD